MIRLLNVSECACMADPYPCDATVECFNTANDGVSYECGPCPDGYNWNGTNCVDIDEVIVYFHYTEDTTSGI